ncbi:hypothetical protein JCM8097_006322 [Rhodosporidiobolus ruineniae]
MDAILAPVMPSGHSDAVRALLQAVATLIVQLDPVEGASAKKVKRVAEDVEEVLRDYLGTLPAPAAELLRSAVASLTFTSPSSSLTSCTSALQSLSTAVHVLSTSSIRPPASHCLPVELLERFVAAVQTLDGPSRQQVNLVLARTCRGFREIVDPILRREIHITSPRQLEGLVEDWDDDGEEEEEEQQPHDRPPRLLDDVRTLTIDLELSEIKLQRDGRWPGQHLIAFVEACPNLEVLHVELRPSVGGTTNYDESDELIQALGTTFDDLGGHFAPKSLRQLAFNPPPRLERFEVSSSGVYDGPHWGSVVDAARMAPHARRNSSLQQLKALIVPFWSFTPEALLALLAPKDVAGPALERLEVTVHFEEINYVDTPELSSVFDALAPTIKHLSLRFRHSVGEDLDELENPDALAGFIVDCLLKCTKLESLEIGGEAVQSGVWSRLLGLPSLKRLTFLQFGEDRAPFEALAGLVRAVNADKTLPLEQLALALPFDPEHTGDEELWSMRDVRILTDRCARAGLRFKLECREEEGRWWRSEIGEQP